MAEESGSGSLELRIQELESKLAEMAAYEPPDITAEEFKAYNKVASPCHIDVQGLELVTF